MKRLALFVAVLGSCGGGSSECDPATEVCTFSRDFGVQTLEPGEERNGLCQSFALHNETELWVNSVELLNDGGYHHSNWFVVPETFNPMFEDGAWDCDERGFNELTAAIAGGVLFAQSTQSTTETQLFAPGVAVRVPPNSRVVGSTHLLNVTDGPLSTGLRMNIKTIATDDVQVKLTPFRLTYYALAIPPMSEAHFSATCDIPTSYLDTMGEPLSLKIHYLLPHYHYLGSLFRLEVEGGAHDGEVLYELQGYDGEAHGLTLDPPIDVSDMTALKFTCGFMNPRDEEVGWGIGDQEMCVMLGFAETGMAFDASVGENTVLGTTDGVVQNTGPCSVLGIPFDQGK